MPDSTAYTVHLIGPAALEAGPDAAPASWGRWIVTHFADWAAWQARSSHEAFPDALQVSLAGADQLQALLSAPHWPQALQETAVVLRCAGVTPALQLQLLRAGVQEVIDSASNTPSDAVATWRALRLGVERKRLEATQRRGWSIDLNTGLPSQALWLEMLNQLCALREREPAAMALLVLRLDGLARVRREHGEVMANSLRRKAAVRLRAGLRASDVVGVLGEDSLAAILLRLEKPQDADKVGAKLAAAMSQPYIISGQQAVLSVALGVANYPQHGQHAQELLGLAQGAAAQSAGSRVGMTAGGMDAANDE